MRNLLFLLLVCVGWVESAFAHAGAHHYWSAPREILPFFIQIWQYSGIIVLLFLGLWGVRRAVQRIRSKA